LLSFSHDDATHMHTQSPRIRVYDATHPRKHQSMQFSYRLFNRYHPSWHVICHPRNHPSMVVRPSQPIPYHSSTSHPWSGTFATCILSFVHKSSMVRHTHQLLLIIHPQIINGSGTLLPHVAYQPAQIIYGSGTLLPLVSFSSIHKSSMVRAPLFYLFLSSIHKSSTVQATSFHPLLIFIHKSSNGSGTLVPPVANQHPQVIQWFRHPRFLPVSYHPSTSHLWFTHPRSFHPRCLLIIHPFHTFSSSSSSLPVFSAILSFPGTERTHTHTHTHSRKNWVLEQPSLMGQNNGRFY
jgi:hypothetical protein